MYCKIVFISFLVSIGIGLNFFYGIVYLVFVIILKEIIVIIIL